MSDLSSLLQGSSGTTQADQLVEAYRRTEQSRVDTLVNRRKALEQSKQYFQTLNSKITNLISQIDKFQTESSSDKFITRGITSSDTTIATASAKSSAALGISTLKVNRLATNDVLISNRVNLADEFGVAAGTKSIDITVNGETKSVAVTFDGDETNQTALEKIAKAINSTEDIGVSAAYVKDTETTGRLTLTANNTGADYNIQFADTDAVLAKFGIDASLGAGTDTRTATNGTSAGFRKALTSDLNSEFELNGIQINRNSNSPEDVLPGVTLTLLKSQDTESAEITLTTTVNRQAVEDLVKPLLDSYNDVLNYLKQQRSQSRTDLSIGTLFSRMRSISSERITGLDDDQPSLLTEIGIKINTDGRLSIDNRDRLEELLKDNPQKVADLFTSSDGFAAKIKSAISSLTGEDGLLLSRSRSLTEQIDTYNDRTEALNARINSRAEALRNEYTNLLEVYYQAESQLNLLGTFNTSSLSSGYGSLL